MTDNDLAVTTYASDALTVRPNPARTALTPVSLQDAQITDGYWHTWQRQNASVTAPHILSWLERDGTIDNLRLAAGTAKPGTVHRGPVYTDSDLYKAIGGMAGGLATTPDSPLRAELDQLVTLIENAQAEDGYINSYVQAGRAQRWADLADGHELYCIGHLIQAGIAVSRAAHDDRLLNVSIRAADCVVDEFGDEHNSGIDGHEEIELALIELFRETQDTRYLKLATQFIDRRGHRSIHTLTTADSTYYQDAVPVRQQTQVEGHAVRALYLLTAVIDSYVETGDPELLRAAIAQWDSMIDSKMFITGALGSRFEGESFGDPYEFSPDRVYGETCAAIGCVMASWRLLLITGSSKYADVIERIFYNLISASTSTSRDSFFYNNPAQRRTLRPPASKTERPTRAEAPGTRPPWFETACCPPNILRTIASLSGLIATKNTDGVQIHQYMPSTIRTGSAEAPIRLTISTTYPASGAITVRIDETPDLPWHLSLRVPAWASQFEVTVNSEQSCPSTDDGYVRISRSWKPGDFVTLAFPVQPRLTRFHPAADGLRNTVALEVGPEVFCLEDFDQPLDTDLNLVSIDSTAPIGETTVVIQGTTERALTLAGYVARGALQSSWMPYDEAPSAREAIALRAIPYRLWANRGPSTMRVHIPLAY